MDEMIEEFDRHNFNENGIRIEGATIIGSQVYDKKAPEFICLIDSLNRDEFARVSENSYKKTVLCGCEGIKKVTNLLNDICCINCLSPIKDDEFDFIWLTPRNVYDRWFFLDYNLYKKLFNNRRTPEDCENLLNDLLKNNINIREQSIGSYDFWYETNNTERLRHYFYMKQDGICDICKQFEPDIHLMHLHHIDRKVDGGIETEDNLSLIHIHCHIQHTNYGNTRGWWSK